jgi:hypothetical protein
VSLTRGDPHETVRIVDGYESSRQGEHDAGVNSMFLGIVLEAQLVSSSATENPPSQRPRCSLIQTQAPSHHSGFRASRWSSRA